MTKAWGAVIVGVAACAGAPRTLRPPSPPGLPGFGGSFRGTLQIHGERPQQVPMGLDVLPLADAATWTWRLHYGEGDTAQVRDYRLCIDDAANGRYRIDEQNGIVLFARACDGELVSVFLAGPQVLCVRYRAVADGIEFALEAFDPAAATSTGEGVRTLAAPAVQRARLHRIDVPPR